MTNQWQSQGLYEHPASHRAGTWGKVALSQAGVYCLAVGSAVVSCPQDWAAKIHAEEGQAKNIIIRNIPELIHREFKAGCAREGKSQNEKLIELIIKYCQPQEKEG